jgi:hypothetical protein
MVVSDASFDAKKTQQNEINRYVSPKKHQIPVANIVKVFSLYGKKMVYVGRVYMFFRVYKKYTRQICVVRRKASTYL